MPRWTHLSRAYAPTWRRRRQSVQKRTARCLAESDRKRAEFRADLDRGIWQRQRFRLALHSTGAPPIRRSAGTPLLTQYVAKAWHRPASDSNFSEEWLARVSAKNPERAAGIQRILRSSGNNGIRPSRRRSVRSDTASDGIGSLNCSMLTLPSRRTRTAAIAGPEVQRAARGYQGARRGPTGSEQRGASWLSGGR